MPTDFLEQLAELEVPAPPAHFDRQLHQRLNQSLLAQHFFDLLLKGLPWAMLQLAAALLGLFRFTVTGQFAEPERNRPDSL